MTANAKLGILYAKKWEIRQRKIENSLIESSNLFADCKVNDNNRDCRINCQKSERIDNAEKRKRANIFAQQLFKRSHFIEGYTCTRTHIRFELEALNSSFVIYMLSYHSRSIFPLPAVYCVCARKLRAALYGIIHVNGDCISPNIISSLQNAYYALFREFFFFTLYFVDKLKIIFFCEKYQKIFFFRFRVFLR